MARAQGARARMALAFETVYGTAPASGFKQMPFASTTLGASQPLLANELLGYGRDPLAPTKDVVTADGDVVAPIDAESFGVWLKAAFGQPLTVEDDGEYTHTFTSGNWTLPSMSVEVALPEVPHFAMNTGCMLNSLQWTMQRSGLLTATANLIAQGETVAATTGAGTPAAYDLIRFGQFNGAVSRNGTPLANVISAQIGYMNNLDRIEVIRSDGKIAGADPSMAMLSGSLVVRFDSQALMTQATDGTASELSFSFVKASGESFTLTIPRVFLPVPKITVPGPAGIQATFEWQAAQQADGGPMCTAVLVNAVEAY
jgi:hypothetical protein